MTEDQEKWFLECVEELDQAIPPENAVVGFEFENDGIVFVGTRYGYLRLCSRIIRAVLKSPLPAEGTSLVLSVNQQDLIFGSSEFLTTEFILIRESPAAPPELSFDQVTPVKTLREQVSEALTLLGCSVAGAFLFIALVVGILTIIDWFRRF